MAPKPDKQASEQPESSTLSWTRILAIVVIFIICLAIIAVFEGIIE